MRKALYAYIIWKAVKFLFPFFFVNGKGYILQFTLKLHRCNVFFCVWKVMLKQKNVISTPEQWENWYKRTA